MDTDASTCPNHPDRKLAKNGTNTKSGTQRYRCTAKGCNYSLSDSPHAQGRPLKGDEPMSNSERQAEYRVRQDERPIENVNLEENQ